METIHTALVDPTIRGWYLMFCMAVMTLPMIAFSFWYHSRVRQTKGGRDLMKDQARFGVRHLGGAIHMGKGIASSRYGSEVRNLQNRMYWLALLYLVMNVTVFGVLLWADEVNR